MPCFSIVLLYSLKNSYSWYYNPLIQFCQYLPTFGGSPAGLLAAAEVGNIETHGVSVDESLSTLNLNFVFSIF